MIKYDILVVSLCILLMGALVFVSAEPTEPNTLSITGKAEVTAVPDIATVTFVANGNDDRSQKLHNFLRENAVDDVDIKSTSTNTYTNRRDGTVVQTGYEIRFKDFEVMEKAIEYARELEFESVSSPQFDVADKEALYATALKQAMKDAEMKANLMLEGRRQKVAGIRNAQEISYYSPYAKTDNMAFDGGVEIEAGTQDVSAQVQVTYIIK